MKKRAAGSGHRSVRCRQFGWGPFGYPPRLRSGLRQNRAGFLEKREKGRTPISANLSGILFWAVNPSPGGNQQALTGIFEFPRSRLLARNNCRLARNSGVIVETSETSLGPNRCRTYRPGLNYCKLLREIHTAQEVLEPWIRAQVIESGVRFQTHHMHRVFLISGLQPMKGVLFLA